MVSTLLFLLCFLDVDECFIFSLNTSWLDEFQKQVVNNTIPCSPDADCSNTLGSFLCQCNANFTGDGRTCSCKFKTECALPKFKVVINFLLSLSVLALLQ